MKLFFLNLFSLLSIAGFCIEKTSNYKIISSVKEKTLTAKEALFVFTFFDGTTPILNKEIIFSYNTTQLKQKPNSKGELPLKVKPGNYLFKFLFNLNYYEIITDSIAIKPGFCTHIHVNFWSSTEPVIVDKPVIYVYPKQKQATSIQLNLKGEFTFTYPEYTNGWNFTANPNGIIEVANKTYHYLFWDGQLNIDFSKVNWNEGFIIDKDNLITFFEEKLTLMGLNSKEIDDYITYWCPRMISNKKNYIHFMFNEAYNNYASITINPKPDNLFRVCMLWSNATTNKQIPITEQKIESVKRSGFTVIEWGGMEVENNPLLFN